MYKNSLHKSNISLSFLHMEHVCCRPSLLAALQPMMLFLRHVLQRPCMLRIHSCTGFKRYASALPEVGICCCYICCLFIIWSLFDFIQLLCATCDHILLALLFTAILCVTCICHIFFINYCWNAGKYYIYYTKYTIHAVFVYTLCTTTDLIRHLLTLLLYMFSEFVFQP